MSEGKVDMLLTLCEQLKFDIIDAKPTQIQLVEIIVKHSLN